MFTFSRNTQIISEKTSTPVVQAIQIVERDRDKVFEPAGYPFNYILLKEYENLPEEQFTLAIEADKITINASEDLGFVYGLLYISEHYLGIKPFWFWMDQKIKRRDRNQ